MRFKNPPCLRHPPLLRGVPTLSAEEKNFSFISLNKGDVTKGDRGIIF